MELLSSVQSSFRNENFVNGSEKLLTTSIVCTPTPLSAERRVEPPTKISKRRTWQDLSFLQGVAIVT